MANEFVVATKKGEVSKVHGYDGYGGLRVRHAFANEYVPYEAGPPEVLEVINDYSLSFIEIPTLPEMIKITAETEVKITFANNAKQAKATATLQADIDELESLGIDNIGLDEREDVIIVPAGETVTYRKRHEKFIAFKGTGVFEAW